MPGKSFEAKRFINVLIRSKDGGNVLRPHILDEIQLLNTLIMQNITVPTDDGKFNLTYQDLCLSYDWVCSANEHIEMFRQMSKVGKVIDLKYPKGGNKVNIWINVKKGKRESYGGMPSFFGNHFFVAGPKNFEKV